MKTCIYALLMMCFMFVTVNSNAQSAIQGTTIKTCACKRAFVSQTDPVTLAINQNGKFHELYWLVKQPQNFSHFIVEASPFGERFLPIETVKVNAQSDALQDYHIQLKHTTEAPSHYRIKVVKTDQSHFYSKVLNVNKLPQHVYPLFFISQQRLNIFQADKSGKPYQMRICNTDGKFMKNFELSDNYEMALSELEKGSYIIHYENQSLQGSWRFVKH
ncbi:MAG: hypothetical protein ACPGJS_19130 [Flammeovirgaceae bacterium]